LSKTYDDLKSSEKFRHGSHVSPGLRIKGQISGSEDLQVDGTIEGPIDLGEAMLTVGIGGKIVSDVKAREMVIHGEVKGSLTVNDRIEIKKDGSVMGNLTTGRILIEDGAHFKGSIEILRDGMPAAGEKEIAPNAKRTDSPGKARTAIP
jgi:cytoskeletal protein CcmA (bactofilin family)